MLHSIITSISRWFLSRSRVVKRVIALSVDFIGVVLALWMAFSLRYSEFYLPLPEQLWIFVLAPIIAIPIFIRFGLYRAVVRYIGMNSLGTLLQTIALYTVIFATIILISGSSAGIIPRTIYAINALILLLFVGGSRLIARWWFSDTQSHKLFSTVASRRISPVIIYGAGSSGVQLAMALKSKRQQRPVAFIDDAKQLHNQQVDGLIVYPFSQLNHLIEKFYVQDVLLAMPSISRARRNEIIASLEPYPIHIRTLPGLSDIAEGKVTTSDIREVDIADLLGREQVTAMQNLLTANIKDKAVMVTGAGGSIGTELCRQIAQIRPKILVLFELNEFALYAIEKELKQHHATLTIMAVLGSVQNQQRLEMISRRFSIQTIYHAAAYKHVPLVEKNASEGISNNIFGTLSCAKAAINTYVETFVLISTDKAVRPTNTMGASKRFSELVLQGLAAEKKNSTTRFTMVRFGNVLGSSGSVVPLFREQIENGGPITVTDARIIRYFMTIPEAAELVIQAGAMGEGGDVFVLDMGSPVKILDLAKRMIHLSGFVEKDDDHPEGDIEIIFTGLRSGEKLYEELLIGDNVTATEHSKISRAQELVINWQQLSTILEQLERLNNKNDCQGVRQLLLKHVEGFQPQCEVQDWLG
jgi:FlaA1/EpsC-like NDP-sugar epimerase